MTWQESFRRTALAYIDKQTVNDGDTMVGEILFCGKCKEPRRDFVEVRGERFLVPRMCGCERKAAEDQRAEMERLKAEQEQAERVRNSGIGARYRDADFSTFKADKQNEGIFNLIWNYVADFETMKANNQGLLFWGGVGTGKTFAAMCVANELIKKGYSVFVTSSAEIMARAKGYETDEEIEFMRKIKNYSLLVIDDLGAERDTDFALEKLYAVIDARYQSEKPTIYTTNITMKDMREGTDLRYERLFDRVFECCFPVKFEGESERIKEARNRYNPMVELMKERKVVV